jgi:hypothetical protein
VKVALVQRILDKWRRRIHLGVSGLGAWDVEEEDSLVQRILGVGAKE